MAAGKGKMPLSPSRMVVYLFCIESQEHSSFALGVRKWSAPLVCSVICFSACVFQAESWRGLDHGQDITYPLANWLWQRAFFPIPALCMSFPQCFDSVLNSGRALDALVRTAWNLENAKSLQREQHSECALSFLVECPCTLLLRMKLVSKELPPSCLEWSIKWLSFPHCRRTVVLPTAVHNTMLRSQ